MGKEKINFKNSKYKWWFKRSKRKLIEREELINPIKFVIVNYILKGVIEDINKSNDKYEEYIKKYFTYDKILNLKNDDIIDILSFLEIYKNNGKEIKENIDYIYFEYKNNFISSLKILNSIDYKEFYDIISDKSFQDEIIVILKVKPLVDYLSKDRYFDEIKYKNENKKLYKFTFYEKGEPRIEDYSEEYKKLMKKLEDGIFFTNLFRLKYLPFKAFINYNYKIVIFPLYYKYNENIDKKNKIIIFKAALKILIIHEIMYILKFMKNEVNFNCIPKTPKERETGKILMNYLFGI